MVRSGSRLELVGVAAGTKLWLANKQKGADRAQLTAAYGQRHGRRNQNCVNLEEEEQRADRKNLPRLGTGGHVAVPASAHSSDYLLRRAQGYFTRKVAVTTNNKRRAVSPRNLLNNTTPARVPVPQRVYRHVAAH